MSGNDMALIDRSLLAKALILTFSQFDANVTISWRMTKMADEQVIHELNVGCIFGIDERRARKSAMVPAYFSSKMLRCLVGVGLLEFNKYLHLYCRLYYVFFGAKGGGKQQ